MMSRAAGEVELGSGLMMIELKVKIDAVHRFRVLLAIFEIHVFQIARSQSANQSTFFRTKWVATTMDRLLTEEYLKTKAASTVVSS
jgi:hypothetical protein